MDTMVMREAIPDDAEALLAFVRCLLAEPDVDVPLTVEEFTYTVESEREFLADIAAADNSVMLLALADQQIVGQLGLTGGKRRATRHAAMLGMSVRRDWRDRGVGSLLLEAAIRWAREGGVITRIELAVYARNVRAIHLYQKYGFQVEGRRRQSIRHGDEALDDLIMALLLPTIEGEGQA